MSDLLPPSIPLKPAPEVAETESPKKANSTFTKKPLVWAGMGALVLVLLTAGFFTVKALKGSEDSTENDQQATVNESDETAETTAQGQFTVLSAHVCPESIFVENGLHRADTKEGHYVMTDEIKTWVETNCGGKTSGVSSAPVATMSENEPPLKLKSVGFTFGAYDKATGMAGDIKFTKIALPFNQISGPFGQQDPRTTDTSKRNPQPTFILPLGTKVRSLVDGEVVEIKDLYSGDATIWVAKDKNSQWFYETEHVKNPLVKVGDKVVAGQIIADVSDYDSHNHPGFGLVEIGILHPVGTGAPEHVCPFKYMDDSVKDEINANFTALYKGWEEYLSKDIYKQETFASPGCVIDTAVQG